MRIDKSYSEKIMAQTLLEHTGLDETVVMEMVKSAPLRQCQKDEVIQLQGEPPQVATYFIISGCVRQYTSDENGKEITVRFYTEQTPINVSTFLDKDGLSHFSLSCIETCILAFCDDLEDDGSNDPPEIQALEQLFFRKQFSEMQVGLSDYKLKSPEERFQAFMTDQPELFKRIPQKYLASYLGITPESFSRFKKRFGS